MRRVAPARARTARKAPKRVTAKRVPIISDVRQVRLTIAHRVIAGNVVVGVIGDGMTVFESREEAVRYFRDVARAIAESEETST